MSNRSHLEGKVLEPGETVDLEVSMRLGDKKTSFDEMIEVQTDRNNLLLHVRGEVPPKREVLFRPHSILLFDSNEIAESIPIGRTVTILIPKEFYTKEPYLRFSGNFAGDHEIETDDGDDYSKLILHLFVYPLWENVSDKSRDIQGTVQIQLDSDNRIELPIRITRTRPTSA